METAPKDGKPFQIRRVNGKVYRAFYGRNANYRVVRPVTLRVFLSETRHCAAGKWLIPVAWRSEEHTSELQSLMRISYAVFCLKKKNTNNKQKIGTNIIT